MTEDDAPLLEIVRRHLHDHPVSGQRLDAVLLHLAGRVGDHLVTIVELHAETGVGQHFGDRAFKFHQFFFCHIQFLCRAKGELAPQAARR